MKQLCSVSAVIEEDTGPQAKGLHVPCRQVRDNVDIRKSAAVVKPQKEVIV